MGAMPPPALPLRADPPEQPLFSEAYKRYALGLLVVVYVFNFLDRQILSILQDSIKRDLQLSDTQLGLLSGFAFALFYTTVGIPIARWADRGVRRSIIALAILVWSGMTAVTGLARSFPALLVARIGVGIGEAGCSPPAHSLISDLFPPARRATALSIYALGIPIGSAIGFFAGGWLDEFFGWRTAFLVVGLPGVLLAVLVRLTLREPPRGYSEPDVPPAASESTRDTVRFLAGLRSFRHLSLAAALHSLYGYGALQFIPSFFRRVHEFSTGELGTWLAVIGLTTGTLGTYLGGYLADRVGQRDARWYVWVPAIATLIFVPCAVVFYLWPDGRQALLLYAPAAVLSGMYLGPTFAMTQALVKPQMRAMASAVLLFILNLIGLGLGPLAVGAISDALEPRLGIESVRYALLSVVVFGALWSSLHYFLAARTLNQDLRLKEST
jgi:predicted MFS family arabinose efflux permease